MYYFCFIDKETTHLANGVPGIGWNGDSNPILPKSQILLLELPHILYLETVRKFDLNFYLIAKTHQLAFIRKISSIAPLLIDIPFQNHTFHRPILSLSSFTTLSILWFLSQNLLLPALLTTTQALIYCRKNKSWTTWDSKPNSACP